MAATKSFEPAGATRFLLNIRNQDSLGFKWGVSEDRGTLIWGSFRRISSMLGYM